MARFSIIAKSNAQVARYEGTPVYNGTYLKPSYVEFREISSPTPIEWEIGDYVDYTRTGLRYKLYSIPQVKKQARSNTYGGAFVYPNVQLFDRTKDFDICPFRDLVPEDNNIHFSTQPTIATFENVEGIAARLQACLDDMFDDWEVRVVSSDAVADAEFMAMIAEPRDFSVNGVSILGALDKIYEVWPLCGWTYSVENGTNVLTIGGANIASAKTAAQTFLYGKGYGLKDIKKSYSNVNEVATRIYAYGSSRNMIPRYYNNLPGIKDAESVDIINLMLPVGPVGSSYSGWGMTDNERDAKKAYIENASAIADMGLRPTTVYFDGSGDFPEIYPTISETTIADLRDAMSSSAQYYPASSWPGDTRLDQIISAGNVDDGSQGSSGEKFVKTESSEFYSFGASLLDGGTASLATLVADDEIAGTAIFTTTIAGTVTVSYGDREPVISLYARIQGIGGQVDKNVKVNLTKLSDTQYSFEVPGIKASSDSVASITVYLAVSLGGQIPSRSSHSSETPSFFISASGGYTLGLQKDIQKKFTVKIPQVGFNIDVQAALGAGKSISFKTGMCAGRTFDIDTCTYNPSDDTWTLSVWRGEDSSLGTWFPNTDFPIAAGDQYVLLDIAMPELYMELASIRLLAKAKELLEYTSSLQPFYEPDIDPKFMVENSRHIMEGQYMALEDDDIIGGTEVVLIDSLTINEGDSSIPTYKVTLRERKKKTWTQSVNSSIEQNSVKSGSNSSKSTTPGVTEEEILAMMFFEPDGNGGVKLKDQYNGLWAAGWISAGGRSETGGGGGGGGDLNSLRSWSAYNASDEGQVLGSNLGKDMYDRIVALENSATSVSFTPAYSLGTSLGTITIDNVSQTIKAGVQILDVADSGSTTAGTWLASNSDITALTDGLTIRYKVTVAGASTTKLNLNGLGAKTVYRNGTTKLTTQYAVGSYILLYYSTSLNSGSWLAYSDYDANSYAYQRVYPSTDDVEYSLTARYNTTSGSSYYTEYGRYAAGVTLNPSKNSITASKFIVTGATSSGFLKGDGSIDTNTYLTGNQTITLSGDVSGSGTTSIAVTIGNGKVTNAMLAGSIANDKLANSSLTVGGATISLGGSATLTQIGVPAWAQASSLAFASLPAMYIGSTAVKSDNTAAGIIGITSINATSSTNHASRIVWDSTNGAWHFYGNIYADGYVSAGGASSTSGGGGGSDVTVLRSWPANPSDQYEALGSNLGQGLKNSVDGLDTRVTALEQSATSVTITNTLESGTRIATISIDGTPTDINAPIPDMSGYVPTTRTVNGKSLATNITLSKSDLGLGNVENTAISTWTGSNYLSTLGTITTGTWNGTPIANTYLEHASVVVGSATIQLGGNATLTELGIPSWAQEGTPDLLIGILDDEFHPKGGRGTLDFSARDLSAVGMLTVGTGGTGNAKIYFNSLNNKLELVNIGTEQSPRYALHSTMPIYSDDFISAGGRSDTTEGSGGGGGVPHVLLSESEWESIQTAGTVDPGTIYLVYENVEEETT